MKNEVSKVPEFRKYYLSEFQLYDGEEFITFNIVAIDTAKSEIQLAVTDRGKISVVTYDLLTDQNGKLYFEYGCMYEKVRIFSSLELTGICRFKIVKTIDNFATYCYYIIELKLGSIIS